MSQDGQGCPCIDKQKDNTMLADVIAKEIKNIQVAVCDVEDSLQASVVLMERLMNTIQHPNMGKNDRGPSLGDM